MGSWHYTNQKQWMWFFQFIDTIKLCLFSGFWHYGLQDMMEILLYTLLFALIHPKKVITNQILSGACRENREEFGFALVGHDYRSVHADYVGRCLFECSLTEKCQSVTYLCDKKECKMNKETKRSRPEDYVENPAATYVENIFRGIINHSLLSIKWSIFWVAWNWQFYLCLLIFLTAKKGSQSSIPGHSCKDILMSGDAQGDTEYWIDPTASGDPFRVFCDMTTDEGLLNYISYFKISWCKNLLNSDDLSDSLSFYRTFPFRSIDCLFNKTGQTSW